jgi:protein TBF1
MSTKSETVPVQSDVASGTVQHPPPKPPVVGSHASDTPKPQHAGSVHPLPQASTVPQLTNAHTQQKHPLPNSQAVSAPSQVASTKPPLQPPASASSTTTQPNGTAMTTNPSNQHIAPPTTAVPAAPRPDPQAEIARARIASLSSLRDLADQILRLLTKMPVVDALALDSDMRLLASGQQTATTAPAEYQRLRAAFEPIRNLYITNSPFLVADHLRMVETSQRAILRKANQAMFCSAIFAGGIGQLALDQNFLDIFVPENGHLMSAEAAIFLELKTQGFMTAMRQKAAPPEQVMLDLFPPGTDQKIMARRIGPKSLAPSEQDFIARFDDRRRDLQDHSARNAFPDLEKKYPYEGFAREVSRYLIQKYAPKRSEHPNLVQSWTVEEREAVDRLPIAFSNGYDVDAMLAKAVDIAMYGPPEPTLKQEATTTNQDSALAPSQTAPTTAPIRSDPIPAAPPNVTAGTRPVSGSNIIPHASQTAPTHVLYQRARMAESDRSPPPDGPQRQTESPNPSLRRTWSEEEEKALMDGLDRVKGPLWSAILALHGPNGSLSEALRDRNQVQLKDKARNLKMFFLKSRIEVPYYLSQVTGTLESRAPGQAERWDSVDQEKLAHRNETSEGMPQGHQDDTRYPQVAAPLIKTEDTQGSSDGAGPVLPLAAEQSAEGDQKEQISV